MLNNLKFLWLMVFLPYFFIGKKPLREFKINGFAQGTTYSISYFAQDSLVTKAEVDRILDQIDSSMSLYKSYSTINKFNQSRAGLALDAHFTNVLKRAFEIYDDSRGLFDITVAPLVQYWGFGPQSAQPTEKLDSILPNIGMDLLELKGNYLTKKRTGVHIDVNGIAQGYAVDVVANFFIKNEVSVFLIEIGGEIRVKGIKPDGARMKIGIEGPSQNQFQEPMIRHVISFESGAITTSGNYRKYLLRGNKQISHLIDPKSGYPLANEMVSVTVYAKDAITADGYDNVLMAMHVNEALDFVAQRKNLEAYIIYRKPDGKLADTLSVGFKELMVN
jgi:thiamine biosynthesis lipoprotein